MLAKTQARSHQQGFEGRMEERTFCAECEEGFSSAPRALSLSGLGGGQFESDAPSLVGIH